MSTKEQVNKESYYSDLINLDLSRLEKNEKNLRSSIELNNRTKSLNADDHHERLMSFEHDLGKTVFKSWAIKELGEHKSRGQLTVVLVVILAVQLAFLNIGMFLIGIKKLTYSDSMINVFITGTFIEITGLLGVIFTYLFKERGVKTLEIALKISENINKHNSTYYFRNRNRYRKKSNKSK